MVKLVDEYCEGCTYLTEIHYDDVRSACYYNVITDRKKPCKCGKGCTEKRTGMREKPRPFESN